MSRVGNLVHETSITTGTGDQTTVSVNGKRSFNTEFGNGATTNVFYYFISHRSAAEWEVGTGHMSAATTLVRDTVISSSNADAAVNFSAGTKDILNDLPAAQQVCGLNTGTAAITIGNSDFGKLVELTGSTSRTFQFTAAATMADGWWCRIVNSSSAEITLDPNGAETIDGLATYKMYPNECRMVRCSGTAFTSIVISSFYLTVAQAASPFTFTKPPGYKIFGARIGAAGASGAKGRTNSAGGGGGGGATVERVLLASAFGATETITIGAGGAAISAVDTAGSVGGNTSIGSLLLAYGGGGGGRTTAAGGGGGGGGGTKAVGTSVTGQTGGAGGSPIAGAATTPGSSVFGGGGGPDGAGSGVTGGESVWGGGGGSNGCTGTAVAAIGGASTYGGGGGGGGGQATAGGAGGGSLSGGAGGAGAFDTNTATDGTTGTNGYAGGGGGGCEGQGGTGNSGKGGDGSAAIWGIA